MVQRRFVRYVTFIIFYLGVVILWGAYVRASGSGAGCGSHWPLCNGQIIPLDPSLKTKIEFFHRITSGLSMPLVLYATVWAFRISPRSSLTRKTATLASISILLEAAIGAALVLFELVSKDQSLKRTISVSLHFSNTLILLGSLVLMGKSISSNCTKWSWKSPSIQKQSWIFTLLFFAVGMAGAITALGDTLFPSQSLTHGIQQDLQSSSHFLIKLRIIHPVLAASFAFLICPWITSKLQEIDPSQSKFIGSFLLTLVVLNLLIGTSTLLLLAPILLQMLHLCIGLCLWISFVIFIFDLNLAQKH